MRRDSSTAFRLALLLLIFPSVVSTATLFAQSSNDLAGDAEIESPAVRTLVARLDSKDPQERVAAAQELSNLGNRARPALPRLVDLLADEAQAKVMGGTIQVRSYAMQLLVEMGPLADDALLDGLGHENRLCRMGIVEVFGKMRSAKMAPLLVKMLGDKDREVASRAMTSLTLIGEPAIEPLLQSLADENSSLRAFAVGTLGKLRDQRVVRPIAKRLYDADKLVRDFAAGALIDLAHDGPLGTIWRASDEIADATIAAKVRAENDAALRKRVIEEVNAALLSDNAGARLAAIQSARRIASPDNCAALAKCLLTDDSAQRLEVVHALSTINHPDVFAPLLIGLQDANVDVRAAAANGLRYRIEVWNEKNPREQLVEPLIAALHDADRRVRIGAAEGLGHLNSVRRLSAEKNGTMVAEVAKLLHDDDVEVAAAALEALVGLHDKQAAEPIAGQLENPKLRVKAAVALGALRDRRAIDALRTLLPGKDTNVIAALGGLKDRESVEPLIKMLDDANESARQSAARALGLIRDTRAVEPLINHLKSSGEVDRTVATALGEIKDPRAIQPLIGAAKPNAFQVRQEGERPSGPLENPVAWPLYYMGFSAVEPLARALKDESVEVRGVAAWVLYNLAGQGDLDAEDMQPAIEPLVAALADRAEVVRNHAAMTLGELGDARAAGALLDIVTAADQASHFYLYENSAAYLSNIRDPKCAEQLMVLLGDERPAIRATATRALGWMKDLRAVEPMLALLKDADAQVRAAAALGLGNLKASAALQPLIALLVDDDAGVRIAAADGLGRLGDSAAAESLAKMLGQDNFNEQVAAAIALVRLNDSRGIDGVTQCLKNSVANNREYAASTVCVSFLKSKALIPPLTAALNDPSIRVRLYAADALGTLRDEAAVTALLAKLDDRENFRSILGALAKSKDARALKVLLRHLDDAEASVRTVAASALGEFGDRAAIDPLVEHLADSTSGVRLAVIGALIKLHAKDALPALEGLLSDGDPVICAHAARAIKRIERD